MDLPDPIPATTGLNRNSAVMVAIIAVFPGFLGRDLLFGLDRLVGGDGILVGCLLAIAAVLLTAAVWLWFKPQRRGVDVTFRPGGLVVRKVSIWGSEATHDLAWDEIEEVILIEAPRSGDQVSLRLKVDAARDAGLMRDTTRGDASKLLVPRKIDMPTALLALENDEIIARLEQSARIDGFMLVPQSGRNLIVFARRTWRTAPL